ncbi:DUF305 domain-containing protein [Puerhibacterium sp. TATVAM-FAB25]|uniref:DUF305 domain-containing protein n=1 Tax=Puerhibacterium sp. TATVAM-FAB25 TaxID=3093699 RepID=UPI003977E7DE
MKRTLVPAVVLAGVAALAACSDTDQPAHDMSSMMSTTASPSAEESAATGARSDGADVMFAQTMIPHHQQAIEMSDVLLTKDGIDPQVTDLATRIKEAQGPEIDTMEQWIVEWGADDSDMGAGHGPMSDEGMMSDGAMPHGMMAEEDLQTLEDAQGAEAQRLFLEQMIVHHRGAIMMAQAEVRHGRDDEAVALAQAIVDGQRAEVRQMEELLAAM